MQTLSISLQNRGREGEPLPVVFRQLAALGAHPRRGQVTMVAAAPGGGKSAFMSFYVRNLDYTGQGDKVPGIYFSADSDILTFGKNALAGVMGVHTTEAERLLEEGSEEAWAALNEQTGHMWVSFQAAPTPADIRAEVDAFAHYYGDWPAWIVIDNLMDIDSSGGGEDERRSQDAAIDFLKQLARKTYAAVFINLHVVGEYEGGDVPIPMKGLMNKVSKRARLIFTLHRYDQNVMGVSVVKNSNGVDRKDGSLMALIPWIPEKGWLGVRGD